MLSATRVGMVIPSDVGFPHLSFFQQTRYKAARHQMSRMEYADLVDLVSCAFGSLADDKRLWCFSPQSLRNALQQHATAERGLDLGSLGGTIHLLLVTEDAELIRRRGRWLAQPTMEVTFRKSRQQCFSVAWPVARKLRYFNWPCLFLRC